MSVSEEGYKLRRNFAKYLAKAYLQDPLHIAVECDTLLDRTGELLGYVREEAAELKKSLRPSTMNQGKEGEE
jgi:hypothetical protein